MMQPTMVTASRALLSGLIDYAGLFPPASLDMASAAQEFRSARTGPDRWVIHRFLCPAGRLEELAATIARTMRSGEQPWAVGLIVDGPLGRSIAAGQAFEAEMAPGASISAVEAELASETDLLDADVSGAVTRIADAAATIGDATMAYCEISFSGDFAVAIAAISHVASTGRRVAAKIRCGGVEAGAVPSSATLATALVAAASRSLPLKATAGLHHPIRQMDPDLGVETHGFLNLAVAIHLAIDGVSVDVVAAALDNTDPAAFVLGASALRWRDHQISSRRLQKQRLAGLHGFGSCSFVEPIANMVVLGIPGVVG